MIPLPQQPCPSPTRRDKSIPAQCIWHAKRSKVTTYPTEKVWLIASKYQSTSGCGTELSQMAQNAGTACPRCCPKSRKSLKMSHFFMLGKKWAKSGSQNPYFIGQNGRSGALARDLRNVCDFSWAGRPFGTGCPNLSDRVWTSGPDHDFAARCRRTGGIWAAFLLLLSGGMAVECADQHFHTMQVELVIQAQSHIQEHELDPSLGHRQASS